MSKKSNVNNNQKNKNTINNSNNYDNVRFLVTKTMNTVIMEELVKIGVLTSDDLLTEQNVEKNLA